MTTSGASPTVDGRHRGEVGHERPAGLRRSGRRDRATSRSPGSAAPPSCGRRSSGRSGPSATRRASSTCAGRASLDLLEPSSPATASATIDVVEPARALRAAASAGQRRVERRGGQGGDAPGRPPRRTRAPARHPGLVRRRRGDRSHPRPLADRGSRVTSGAQPTAAARLTSRAHRLPLRPVARARRDAGPGSEVDLRLPRRARRRAARPRGRARCSSCRCPTAGKSNPITGPLAIEGAEPGDALVVGRARHRRHQPRLGRRPRLRQPALARAACRGRSAGSPRCATASSTSPSGSRSLPARCSAASAWRPSARRDGVDSRSMPAGRAATAATSTRRCSPPGRALYLPVYFPGALLYIGDVHAAQGDGELSGTAIEIGATVRVRVDLSRARRRAGRGSRPRTAGS